MALSYLQDCSHPPTDQVDLKKEVWGRGKVSECCFCHQRLGKHLQVHLKTELFQRVFWDMTLGILIYSTCLCFLFLTSSIPSTPQKDWEWSFTQGNWKGNLLRCRRWHLRRATWRMPWQVVTCPGENIIQIPSLHEWSLNVLTSKDDCTPTLH